MAPRQPLFQSAEGFAEEMALTDSMTLGGLTMGGNIAMGTHKITNLGAPSDPGDAATMAYVDALAQGLKPKAPAIAISPTPITTLAGPKVIDTVQTVEGDRVLLIAQASGVQNGIWVVHEGPKAFLDLAVPGDKLDTVIQSKLGGADGNNIQFAAVDDSTNPATLIKAGNVYTLHFTSGTTDVTEVEALIAAALTIEIKTPGTPGQKLTASDAFVATNLASGSDTAWTRPSDFAALSHAAAAYLFIEEGSAPYADTGWVCTTNPPNDVVGTNNLAFVQFSGAGVVTASTGLTKVINDIQGVKGDGIELVSNSAAINVDIAATNPGLHFVGASPNGKLAAQVKSVAGGLEIDGANGIAVNLDGSTLAFDAGGSAAGLSVAYSPKANAVSNPLKVKTAVLKADPVYYTGTDDQVDPADTTDAKAKVVGVALAAQPTPGGSVDVVSAGPALGVLGTSGAVGVPYYLQTGGHLGTAVPSGGGARVIQVGIGMNLNDLFVRIIDYGKKAA